MSVVARQDSRRRKTFIITRHVTCVVALASLAETLAHSRESQHPFHLHTIMRRAPRAEQPLRLLFDGPRPSYVCRACRQRTSKPPARQFHASAASSASGKPWITTIRESLFGSKNKAAAAPEEDRDLSASAANPEEYGVEITTDRRGNEYEVAQRVDPTRNKDYVVAHTWDGLESIGSEHWVRQRVDKGHQFEG